MKRKLLYFMIFICGIANAQFTKLHDFTGVANGIYPLGTPVSDGTYLYGMAGLGGTSHDGVIFKIKTDGTAYSKLLDFNGLNGSMPGGSLIYDGTYLYGMTPDGGVNNQGVIFKIKPDGSGYTKLLDFEHTANAAYPAGSLFSDGTFLYGMTTQGGINDRGIIFKIKKDGTGYFKLRDFSDAPDGYDPKGTLIADGTFLYGTTNGGGINDMGTIFKIKPDGTEYTQLFDFSGSETGGYPLTNDLMYDGTFLYGMTANSGIHNNGVIYKIKTDGTEFSKLMDFSNITSGSVPGGSLISDGIYLYGMTEYGGLYGDGTIFKIKPDGTGFLKLADLAGSIDGGHPGGSLIADESYLYGINQDGGTGNYGTIFKYSLTTTGINEQKEEENIMVFPNPVKDQLNIRFVLTEPVTTTIEIKNMLGQTVYTESVKNATGEQIKTILVSEFARGVYLLQLKSKHRIISKKFNKD